MNKFQNVWDSSDLQPFVGQPKTTTRDSADPSRSSQTRGKNTATSRHFTVIVLLAYQVFPGATSSVPNTETNPAEPNLSTLETVKDYIGVGWSLTQMLLQKTPDAVDTNPVKIVFGLAKIILQLKEVCRQFFL